MLCKPGSDMLPVGTRACMRDKTEFVLYLSGVPCVHERGDGRIEEWREEGRGLGLKFLGI